MQDSIETGILIVTTTIGSIDAARLLARAIVDAGLAACVQLEPLAASVYHWQGKVCEEPEVRLTIKTVAQRRAGLQAFLAEHHPYALPQFTAWAASCSPEYAQWVRDSLESRGPA
jgi:periplasmic divalent cation tolerance protein